MLLNDYMQSLLRNAKNRRIFAFCFYSVSISTIIQSMKNKASYEILVYRTSEKCAFFHNYPQMICIHVISYNQICSMLKEGT